MSESSIRFLSIETVRELHLIAIQDQGGDPGVRDIGLLDSALAMPRQQFGGAYLHPTIPAMAAAYAFHICKNHPFVDGNKRAAFAAMLAFLIDNGWTIDSTPDEAEQVVLRVADGSMTKDELTRWLLAQSHEKQKLELRDFFSQLTWQVVQEAMKSSLLADRPAEFQASLDEASTTLPLLGQLREAAQRAHERGDDEQFKVFTAQMSLLMHLYRCAEDIGYEW